MGLADLEAGTTAGTVSDVEATRVDDRVRPAKSFDVHEQVVTLTQLELLQATSRLVVTLTSDTQFCSPWIYNVTGAPNNQRFQSAMKSLVGLIYSSTVVATLHKQCDIVRRQKVYCIQIYAKHIWCILLHMT